ncbi:MAG: PilZ domain-containing protein [Bdellovibrionales bacterium]
MGWKRKQLIIDQGSQVHALAMRLGVWHRRHPRLFYPDTSVDLLPTIEFREQPLKVVDISVGGCCLLDPEEHLGPRVGQEAILNLKWRDAENIPVRARLVSRVDHRRHFQFLDLPMHSAFTLNSVASVAVRAHSVRRSQSPAESGPTLLAREIWCSARGDGVALLDHAQEMAIVNFANHRIHVWREKWPMTEDGKKFGRVQMGELLVFLANIPCPGVALRELSAVTGRIYTVNAP